MARKRKLGIVDAEPRAKRHRAPPKYTRESLVLGRHILDECGSKWFSESFRHVKHPEKMTSPAGKRVREFVENVCSRDPMATFARMCLVPRNRKPLVPTQEGLEVLAQLTQGHFRDLWMCIGNVFHSHGDLDATFSLQTKFIRGALAIADIVPVGWDKGVEVLDPMRLLSCDEIVSYAESDRTTGAADSMTCINALDQVGAWHFARNEQASRRLCKIIERDVAAYFESKSGPIMPEDIVQFIYDYDDIFVCLIAKNAIFADPVCSFASVDDFRHAFEQVYQGFAGWIDNLCRALQAASESRRAGYYKLLCEHGFLPPLANIMAGY